MAHIDVAQEVQTCDRDIAYSWAFGAAAVVVTAAPVALLEVSSVGAACHIIRDTFAEGALPLLKCEPIETYLFLFLLNAKTGRLAYQPSIQLIGSIGCYLERTSFTEN
jgi:hypothetical protein